MGAIKTNISQEKCEASQYARQNLVKISPIHGFGFIEKSKNRVETVFWVGLMAIFCVVLTRDLYILIDQFVNRPTLTRVQMNFNDSLPMQDTVYCIYIVADDIPWLDAPGKDLSFDKAVEEALKNYTTREEFMELEWCPEIKKAAREYFREMTYWETYDGTKTINVTSTGYNDRHTAVLKSMVILEEYLERVGVTQREMFDKMGKYLRELLNLRVTLDKGGSKTHFYDHRLTQAWSVACFHMEMPANLTTPSESIVISGDTKKLEPRRKGQFRTMKMSLERKRQVQDDDPVRIHMKLRERRVEELEIAGFYTSSLGKKCDEKNNKQLCRELCRAEAILNKCGCVPFSKSDLWEKDYPKICRTSDYFGSLTYEPGALDCAEPCLPPCQMFTYRTNTKYVSTAKKYEFSISLSYGHFAYPSFEEYEVQIWQNFMADFGGTLGIYFGASFLSLIHIIFYTAKSGYNQWSTPSDTELTEDSAGAPVVLYSSGDRDGTVKWGCPSPRASVERLEIPKRALTPAEG